MGPTVKEFTEQLLQTPETIPQCSEPSGGQSHKASSLHEEYYSPGGPSAEPGEAPAALGQHSGSLWERDPRVSHSDSVIQASPRARGPAHLALRLTNSAPSIF